MKLQYIFLDISVSHAEDDNTYSHLQKTKNDANADANEIYNSLNKR